LFVNKGDSWTGNVAYLAPKSFIAGTFDAYLQAKEAAKRGDQEALSLMMSEGLITKRGEELVVLFWEMTDDYTKISVPSLFGIKQLYVRTSDLSPTP
jgi:hypothetical protein